MPNINQIANDHIQEIKEQFLSNKQHCIRTYKVYSHIEISENEKTCKYISTIKSEEGDLHLLATTQTELSTLVLLDNKIRILMSEEFELQIIWDQTNLKTPVYNF